MNKRLNAILICLSIFLMSCAISKKENDRFEQILNLQSNLDNYEYADSLTLEQLQNFEVHAAQKLEDFYDYLSLLSNDKISDVVKEEIRYSAVKLYYDPNLSIVPFQINNETEGLSLSEYLMAVSVTHNDENGSITSLEIIKPLEYVQKYHYEGSLAFQIKIDKDNASEILHKKADFSLRRMDKEIRNETVEMWEVFLDKIE
jgi:hypothetical protein